MLRKEGADNPIATQVFLEDMQVIEIRPVNSYQSKEVLRHKRTARANGYRSQHTAKSSTHGPDL